MLYTTGWGLSTSVLIHCYESRQAGPLITSQTEHSSSIMPCAPNDSNPPSTYTFHLHLVLGPPALSDDLGHLVNLSLRAAECAEPLLRELSRTLVLAVAEEFDDAALVWCEATVGAMLVVYWDKFRISKGCVPSDLLDDVPNECGSLAQVSLHARDTRLRLAWGDLLYGEVCQPGVPPANARIPRSYRPWLAWSRCGRRT